MSKDKPVLYFEKRYQLLLHSLSVGQRVSISTLGAHTAHKELFERTLTYSLNQVVDVSCIDLIQNGTTISDNQPLVSVSTYDNREGRKIEIGLARFDMNFQKMVKSDSSVIYSKQLQGGRGTLSYKFISVKTKTLTEDEYASCRSRKEAIEVELFKDEQTMKIKNLMNVLNGKNELVEELQKKIEELIVETNRRGGELANQRERGIDRRIELSMKINPVQRHLKHENQTLKAALEEELEKSRNLEWKLDALSDQKDAIEKSLVMSKKQYDKLNQIYRSSNREKTVVSEVGGKPKFLKQSTDENEFVEDKGTKVYILQPPPIEEPKRRRNTIAETSSLIFGGMGNSMMRNSKQLDTVIEEETNRLDAQPLKNSSYISKDDSSRMSASEVREALSPTRKMASLSRIDDDINIERLNAVSKRISMQKDDLKLTSIIFEKDEELILLQKKCQLFQAQTKQLEKEYDRCQQLLKKKEVQIRQLKRRSKKNLLLDVSSRDLKTTKNRSQVEAQFQKIQAEYQSQKLASEQHIDKLQMELNARNKQIKQFRLNFQETSLREKTLSDRYSQLKIANKKLAEQSIEYKQKSLQYDKMVLAGRQLESDNKVMKEKLAALEEQNIKLEAFYNKFNNKCKEQQKQLQRLRKLEREYEYLKNQSSNLKQSIDGYEARYGDLKKYCLKIEAAYSKFVSKQKKGGFSSGDYEEDKEIHGKFAQLHKKVNDCELSYFKQQLEDCKDESQFIQVYYEKKKRQQKQKIIESKDISQQLKESSIKAKEEQLEKALSEKMSQIQTKILNLEKSLGQVQHRSLQGSQTFIETVPEKIKKIELRVSTIIEREHQREKDRAKLKDTISNLQEELRLGKSNINPMMLHNQGSGHISSQNNLLQSMIAENRQRKTMLEEARLKSEQVQLKTYEQNRKLNTNLMRENHEVKSQLSKLKMQAERAERKAQERQKNMQGAFKKSEYEYKLKIQKLNEDLERIQLQTDKFKEDCDEQRLGVSTLETQMTHLSSELEDKDIEIGALNQKIQTLESQLQDCRTAEKQMREEVEEIKSKAELNQKQFLSLIDARSADFLKIQHLKEAQSQKLKAAITMLEQSLEVQMFQNMKHVSAFEKQKEEMEKYQRQAQAKIQDYVLALQNRGKELDDLYIKELLTTKENQSLKTGLMDISSQINSKEVENVELHFRIESLQKQIAVYERQVPEHNELQKKLKAQIDELNTTLKDKNYQMKYFQQKFMRVQTQVELSSKELERLTVLNAKYEETIGNWQQKYRDQQQEIIRLKEEHSMAKIEIEKIKLVFSGLGQQNQTLKLKIQELQEEIAKLNHALANAKEEKENFMSKRHDPSFIADDFKIEVASPNRRSRNKSPPKRNENLEVSANESCFGFGGITPINPVPITGFPRRMDSLDSNRDDLLQVPKRSSAELKRKDQTQIQINLQDLADMSRINTTKLVPQFGKQCQEHEQLLISNAQSLTQTNFGMNKLIVQQSDEHKEGSYNYGKNIDLNNNEEQDNDNLREELDRMQGELDKLKQELAFTSEENQKLYNQIAELEGKLELTSHLGQTQNNQLGVPKEIGLKKETSQLSQMRPSSDISINKSSLNRSNIAVNRELHSSRDIKKSSEPQSPMLHHRQRSNSGADRFPQTEYISLNQKYEAAELEIQELKGAIYGLKNELEGANQNNQKLIEQINEYTELLTQKQNQLQQVSFEVEQYKKFQVFEEYYKQEAQKVKEITLRVEELTAQTLQKDEKMAELLRESNQVMEQANLTRQELTQREDSLEKLNKKIKELSSIIARNKSEYRQYQQTAELQIMHLKEQIDDLKAENQQKDRDKAFLGEQYIELEHEKDKIKEELNTLSHQISKRNNSAQEGQDRIQWLEQDLEKSQKSRQQILKTVKRLQSELMQKSQMMKNTADDSVLSFKKFEIKLQSNQQQLKNLVEKLQQKQKVISLLKNEIALYNEESEQLRKSNDALHYELDKVEKELKDIMQVYAKEIEGMQLGLNEKDKVIEEIRLQLRGKVKGEDSVLKQMRSAEKERDLSKHELIEVKSLLEKVKASKARELNEANSRYQFKADECEKIKSALDKINTELACKEQQISQVKSSYQAELQGYKQRYQKYEEGIVELQQQLLKVKDRPTAEVYEQVVFENELLRNEIQELRQQVNRPSSRIKEEQIFVEFKKYKRTRQQEIQDLRSQMEQYGAKIGEMEECIFGLRKENQLLRQNNAILIEQRDEFEAQCEDLRESMVDVEKELQFYKKRKMLDMQKLMNETH